MRKFIFLFVFAIICSQYSHSQNSEEKRVFIKPGISLGLGVFYPKEINDYIEADLSNYITSNENMYINFFLRGSFGIQFSKMFVLEPVVEFAIAPKIVIGADKSYIFGRVSPGVLANLHVPVGKRRNTFFLGGGALYHHMWFKDFSGGTIGPAFQAGFSMNFGKSLNPEVFAGFNYAKAQGKDKSLGSMSPGLELSYTDFHLGIRINFKM
jgi:hypothetical protein